MAEASFERRVFWDRADIPQGTKAILINVMDPYLKFKAEDGVTDKLTFFQDKKVYVELTYDEWLNLKANPGMANEFAEQFGELVQKALGAKWHRWHSPKESSEE